MADVTGHLGADFSKFFDAVEQAKTRLVLFEGNAAKVEKALGTMTDSFSGRKIIQEATLMAEVFDRAKSSSSFTSAELQRMGSVGSAAAEKLRALGKDVPEGIQRIADAAKPADAGVTGLGMSFGRLTASITAGGLIERGVMAVVDLGVASIKSASDTVNLADKLGLSTTTIQQMQFVADQTGTTLDTFGNAALKLGTNLAGGTGSTRQAVADLGLEFASLRAQSPDEQFNAVTAALERMTDPQERNRLAIELFGKAGAEILPAIVQGYQKIAAQATLTGEAQIRSVDAASNAWSGFVTSLKSGLVTFAGNYVLMAQTVAKIQADMIGLDGETLIFGNTVKATTPVVEQGGAALASYGERAAAAEKQLAGLNEATRTEVETAKRLGASVEDITDRFGLSADAQKLLTESIAANKKTTDDATRAAEKHAAAMAEMQSSGEGWRGTLATMDAQMVTSIENYLKAGVSQASLATFYGLTATQVKAVATSLKEQDEIQKITDRSIQETTKLWEQHYADRIAHDGTATEAATAHIDAWFNTEVARLDKSDLNWANHYAALEARRADFKQNEEVDWNYLSGVKTSRLEKAANDSKATYEYMQAHVEEYSYAHRELARQRMEKDKEAWLNFRNDGVEALDAVKGKLTEFEVAYAQLGETVEATTARARESLASLSGATSTYTMGIRPLTKTELENLASGGFGASMSNADPSIALMKILSDLESREGTYAPKTNKEYFEMVKDQTLLAQLRMWAKGEGNPVTMTNNFQIVDTEANLARRVGDEIMTRVRSGSQLTTS
jgi:hypothetical protein